VAVGAATWLGVRPKVNMKTSQLFGSDKNFILLLEKFMAPAKTDSP